MGLAFERIDPVHQQALDRFVEQHFFSDRRA
jgi:c-di-GMP-binding flagellar brake protein YcgR